MRWGGEGYTLELSEFGLSRARKSGLGIGIRVTEDLIVSLEFPPSRGGGGGIVILVFVKMINASNRCR